MHTKDARKTGESEQRLYAVAAWHEAPFFRERERASAHRRRDLVADTHVAAEVYEQAAREFDPEELAHLLWQITTTNAWNRVAVATRKTFGERLPTLGMG